MYRKMTLELRTGTRIKNKLNGLFDLYKTLAAPLKASLWFTVCNFLQQGISMITVPVFTRLLSPDQYGVYTKFQSWYSIVFIFATLNLSAGVYNNGMLKYEKDRDRYTSSLQGLSTLLTVFLFFVYSVNMEFWNRRLGLSTLFVISMFIEFLFIPSYLFWSARQRFEYKYRGVILVTMIIALGSPILGILAVISTDYKTEARILSFVLVQAFVGLVFYIHNAMKGKTLFYKDYWKFALVFNIPLIPHYLSISVLGQVGRIMIADMVGDDKAAIFSVAGNISVLIALVTQAINNSFIPYTYKALRDKKYKEIAENADKLLILVSTAAVMAMAFGPEIIRIFAPEAYYEAIWIIPPMVAGSFFAYLYPMFGNIEFYFEENKYVMVASITGAIANVALNLLLIPVYGYMAAGYSTLICYILFGISHYVFHKLVIRKHIPGVKIYHMKFMIGISGMILAAMTIILFLYQYTLIRYGLILMLLTISFLKRNFILKQIKEIRKK